MTSMKIYKENIVRCNEFYNSDFYKFFKENDSDFLEIIFTELCLDADECDEELYIKLGEKYNLERKGKKLIDYVDNEKIILSADVICGRKQLIKINDEMYPKWIKDYETIRSKLDLHFIWPRHKLPTINTYRYAIYKDRIDCLLYDLKMHFNGEKPPMDKAYSNGSTKIWLRKFKDFPDFINKMKINDYVDKNYNVLDIEKNDGSIIIKYIQGKELNDSLVGYLRNVLALK